MPWPEGVNLAIETSNPSSAEDGCGWKPGVALTRVVDGVSTRLGAEALGGDGLMMAVDRVFRGAGVAPREVRGVAVSIGPGGFTALRTATASAKMIAEATGAEVRGVPSAWVAARRAGRPGRFAVALAGKGDSAWVTWFDGAGREMEAGRLVDGRAFSADGLESVVADRYLPGTFAETCARAGVEIHRPVFDAYAVLEAGEELAAMDPVALLPLYPREPEAVTKWRALGR
ncbi:MAG: hypothetical protein HBSAPP03_06900 [Phycisphaerae bacterium]|nr:MAG: hypothetical protein HBSAPP03_06900 [Phycisphaerae bacterium]